MTKAPTTRETADHIGEANEKVVDHIGDATTMIDHAGLAACPFCGSSAKLSRIISPEGERRGDRPSWDAECQGCGTWRRFDSKEDAVEAWNLRGVTAIGSGDHAELARLAEAATPGPWAYRDMTPNTYGPAFVDADDVRNLAICGEAVGRSETHGFCLQVDSEVRMANAAFIAAANPAAVLALLSEIAALRGEHKLTLQDGSEAWCSDAAWRWFQEWAVRLEQAERQRDEAVGLLTDAADELASEVEHRYEHVKDHPAMTPKYDRDMDTVTRIRAFLANQGADQ